LVFFFFTAVSLTLIFQAVLIKMNYAHAR